MAWAFVAGSNDIWKYDNAAVAADTYSDANGTIASGIRTFTFAGGNVQKTYIKSRTEADLVERGELSKDFYDAQVG
jgi:hypothetical protein